MHTKGTVFAEIKTELLEQGFSIVQEDAERPWGGFFVIDEGQAQAFANTYFDGLDVNGLKISGKLSPKILLVAPGTRLSWQYHHRRAEIWCLIKGTAGVCTSFTDVEGPVKTLSVGECITLQQGERHRLLLSLRMRRILCGCRMILEGSIASLYSTPPYLLNLISQNNIIRVNYVKYI
jgi:mannose-6-phosphate isomerase-like protein (cupin superfamily)